MYSFVRVTVNGNKVFEESCVSEDRYQAILDMFPFDPSGQTSIVYCRE